MEKLPLIGRLICTGLSALLLTPPVALAQSTQTKLKKAKVKKEVAKSPFSGSVLIGLGQDTNIGDTKDGTTGSFYQLKPSLNYKQDIFFADLSAGIKDFNDQSISNNAKETSGGVALGIDTKIFGKTESKTQLGFSYNDNRIPDYFNGGDSVSKGSGMADRHADLSVSQTLKWTFDKLSVQADGSFTSQDYSSKYSDFVDETYGSQVFEMDNNKWEGKARVGIALNDFAEIAATPLVSHKKFDDRQARESNGERIGDQGQGTPTGKLTEYVVNEMKAEIKFHTDIFEFTPHVTSGINIDQATGGEDYSYNAAGLTTSVIFNKAYNVKLSGGFEAKNKQYDNWTYKIPNGDKRENDTLTSHLEASFDITKSLNLGMKYENTLEESNYPSGDLNYRQEIYTSGLTVKF